MKLNINIPLLFIFSILHACGGNKKQQKIPKSHQFQKPTSSLDDENSNLLTNLLSSINTEKKVTIILSTTDLYKKLPTSRDYLLKDGTLSTKKAS